LPESPTPRTGSAKAAEATLDAFERETGAEIAPFDLPQLRAAAKEFGKLDVQARRRNPGIVTGVNVRHFGAACADVVAPTSPVVTAIVVIVDARG